MTYKHVDGTEFPNVIDRYLIGTSDFEANDVITGFTSGAKATVANSGSVYDAFPGSVVPEGTSVTAVFSIDMSNVTAFDAAAGN